MKIGQLKNFSWGKIFLCAIAISVIWSSAKKHSVLAGDEGLPVTVKGVHHLGPDYLISQFYIDKKIGDGVGEGGGGGSNVCCLILPKKWTPDLKVEVRWEVHHIVRPHSPLQSETAELVGIYQAQVPVEKYKEPDLFWVHFFSDGKVRVVVTPFGFDGDKHPIQWGNAQAAQLASSGKIIREFFSEEEVAEFARQADIDKKNLGGW
ncbi:DUF3304 domain-containing protein [Massilia sp. YIM B02443]|uniref:DUF3304 domain-containing protein n=1 Tax=Massilia sp. YIM B02443 TaxID=3050127 RepID=UPI0025B6BD73|nr:DUF3304 domain-containing protein [Massilia sp. YIM B02443]MDN4036295.1 DUF3304 domain-containing protein [Massilia sp. YIM B02443]